MDTIVPSANAVIPSSDGILKSVSTTVTDIIDSIDLKSPPAHALELSYLEQANPRGYTRPMFFFPAVKGVNQMEVAEIFRKALEPTLKAIPSLACEIVPVEDGKTPTGRTALKHGKFGSLIVKDIRGTGFSYEELRKQKFPQSRLDPDVLCACDVFPVPGEIQPAWVPQLNIVDGGFILTLHNHHTLYDAQAINEILRVWSQNCRHVQNKAVSACSSLPAEQFERSAHITTRASTADLGNPEQHPEFVVAPFTLSWPEAVFRDTHRQRVYRLSPKALAELKNDCTESGDSWISTNDAATALMWRCIIRAQTDLDTIPEDVMSHHIVVVDLRLRSDPPLSKHYPGCPMNYARPGMNLRQLCNSTSLAPLARAIRNAVDERTPEYTKSVVTLLNNIPGYGHFAWTSFGSLLGTDCMTSTWYKLDILDLDFGPAIGQIERVRFPTGGLLNGLSLIYPQITRGEQQDLGMEVAVGLEKQYFEKLDEDPVWCKYAELTDPGYDCM
ncbi:unnamed protein product [Aureobasidium vineae]|uniref:Trichothecene 3-O-acetyltransferase-like N-terminal domain-containing protein n=1 Tax=Aureobasidium vineae TaxID=2773715 RepID=A0A9N8JK30_9PEZI|nr:unnamed protein product [Aureobasidium vineae]